MPSARPRSAGETRFRRYGYLLLGALTLGTPWTAQADRSAEQRVLLVLPHPDDETMIGGLLGRLRELKVAVHALVVTDGSGGRMLRVDAKGQRVAVTKDPARLRALRRREMREAAARFGIAKLSQLDLPDVPLRNPRTGKPSRDVVRFLRSHAWDLGVLRRAIIGEAAVFRPTLIITTLDRGRAIHAHHKAVGRIVRQLGEQQQLGRTLQAIYGMHETDWYPAGTFDDAPATVRLARARYAQQLGMTYGAFATAGAAAHRSQAPGWMVGTAAERSTEALRRLDFSTDHRDPLRALLRGKLRP